MSFHLAFADDAMLLHADRPVIKAKDRAAFADALALLAEARKLREQASVDAAAARDDARCEGRAEAVEAAQHTVAAAIAKLAADIEAHAESRRADIAEAAFAAARAIVGAIDEDTVMMRVVDRTLARFDADIPLTIEVAPALAAVLRVHVGGLGHVTVTENPALAATDCHVLTPSGRIVASLSVQFDALAARWGLSGAV